MLVDIHTSRVLCVSCLSLLPLIGARVPSHRVEDINEPDAAYRRDIVTLTLVKNNALSLRYVLHAPLSSPSWNMAADDEYDESFGTVARPTLTASMVIDAGMGRTCGVSGTPLRPIVNQWAVSTCIIGSSTIHILPYLIWAFGIDITTMRALPSSIHVTPLIASQCRYAIGDIVMVPDPEGFRNVSQYHPVTGLAIHQPQRINNTCKWLSSQVIDIAMGINGSPCVRINHLSHACIWDDWFDHTSPWIRRPIDVDQRSQWERQLGGKHRRYVDDTIMTYMTRTATAHEMTLIQQAIDAVHDARRIVMAALVANEEDRTSVEHLPRVLAIIVASYAI